MKSFHPILRFILPILAAIGVFGFLPFIHRENNAVMNIHPQLQTSARQGTGFVWEFRRALAVSCWIRAQDYFHRGFSLSDFIRPEDLQAFQEHENEHIGALRQAIQNRAERLARGQHTPPDEPHSDHQISIDSMETTSTHSHESEADEEREEALIAHRFGLDTHPLLNASLLRPYILQHEHGEGGVPMMLPWYWLTTTLDPAFIRAYSNGSWWLAFVRQDKTRALNYLDDGLLHTPGDPDLLMARGEIEFRLNQNNDAAIRDFRAAVAGSRPNTEIHEFALRYLAFALDRAQQTSEACRIAREGIAIYPGHPVFPTIAERNCR